MKSLHLEQINNDARSLKQKMGESSYIILVGSTGAGKSTVANILTGKQLVEKEENGKFVYDVQGYSEIKIGHKNSSETTKPNILGNVVDCPGFEDTDPRKELENFIYVKTVFGCQKQKIIFVSEYSSIFDGRCQRFIKLIDNFDKATGFTLNSFSRNLGMCVTKTPSGSLLARKANTNAQEASKIIQTQLTQSNVENPTIQKVATIVKDIGDHIVIFKDSDEICALKPRFDEFISKIEEHKGSFPISPSLSHEGVQSVNQLISSILEDFIETTKCSVENYLSKTGWGFKDSCKKSLKEGKNFLNSHNSQHWKEQLKETNYSIENASNMKMLTGSIKNAQQHLKNLNFNTSSGLDQIDTIMMHYNQADEVVKSYQNKISNAFSRIIRFEEKLAKIPKDISNMDNEWNNLTTLTTSSTGKKILIGVGGAALSVGAGIATGGLALLVEGAVAASAIIGGGAILGGTIGALTGIAIKKCDAYEESHPEVAKHRELLMDSFKAVPSYLADSWLTLQKVDGEYLPELKTILGSMDHEEL